MTRTIDAIYEDGILRPLQALEGLPDHAQVRVTVEGVTKPRHPLADCIGILPDDDAAELLEIMEREFEQVDSREWR